MKSKYCEVGAFISHHPPTVCGLTIEATKESHNLKEDVDKWLPTEIEFHNLRDLECLPLISQDIL